MLRGRIGILVAVTGVYSLGLPLAVRADQVVLKGGGGIKGVVLPDPSRPDSVVIQTETSSRPLILTRAQVQKIVPEAGPLDEYMKRRDRVKDDAQDHFDLATWCEERKLSGPAEIHYRRAVEIDPAFAPAHKKLGHVQHGSRWLTYDEQKQAQGLVKIKGKWILRSEKDKLDAQAALAAEQASWTARLKILRRKLMADPDPERRREAEAQLNDLRDPAAVPGLIAIFGDDSDAVRVRIAQILGKIKGSEATDGLIRLILREADADVFQAIADELARRRDEESIPKLVSSLKLKDPNAVGRAAWALAALKATSAVPKLVEVLVVTERKQMFVPVTVPNGGGNAGVSFNSAASGSIPSNAPPGFNVVGAYPVLTGPAVAPGVIAFGATSSPIPYGSNPTVSSPADSPKMMPARVEIRTPNPDVLRALATLTGEDFGFDQPSWRRWITTSFRPEQPAPRRVPQP